jgi:type VI secretion system protein ImpA
MPELVEKLLQPLSDEAPCGEDLSYDPGLQELDVLVQGKPETQFSAAEEPNWKQIRDRCLELFDRTKDLRPSLYLCLALIPLEGIKGFGQGLAVMRGLLEKYWEPLYPRLDPEENNDPTERVNLIASMAIPAGTFGDTMRFIDRLRGAPLCRSAQLGSINLAQILAAQGPKAAAPAEGEEEGAAKAGPNLSLIEAAFRATDAETLQGYRDALKAAIADAQGIDDTLTTNAGVANSADLERLHATLRDMEKAMQTFAPASDADAAAAAADSIGGEGAAAQAAAGGVAGVRAPGSIGSREDVKRSLDAICDFYAKAEPSSPVPALLRHAQKLVGKEFMEILQLLSPDAQAVVKLEAPAAE